MRSSLKFFLVLATSFVFFARICRAGESDDPPIEVEISQSHAFGHVDCHYRVINHTEKAIVGFVLGAGDQAAGPYELTLTPKGIDSPAGWEFSVFSPDPNQRLAVEWQTKQDDRALMPGETIEDLTIRYDRKDMPCDGVHWTTIDRDSELLSGTL